MKLTALQRNLERYLDYPELRPAHAGRYIQGRTRLGHSSIQITLDVYGHLFDAAGDQLAAKMGEAREKALKADTNVVPLPVHSVAKEEG